MSQIKRLNTFKEEFLELIYADNTTLSFRNEAI